MSTDPSLYPLSESTLLACSVHQVLLETIRVNPLNEAIYDAKMDPGFLQSVEEKGVLVPVVLTQEGLLIDGHQRVAAARQCGFRHTPAHLVDVEDSEGIRLLLEYNRQRQKTVIERIREYRAYLQLEAVDARRRMEHRPGENLPEGEIVTGRARKFAAIKVGLSDRSAENGLKVWEEVERRQVAGLMEEVTEVRAALEHNVHRGMRAARKLGWFTQPPLRLGHQAETHSWFEPCMWQNYSDTLEDENARSRLESAFRIAEKIFARELNPPDAGLQKHLIDLFVGALRASSQTYFRSRES